MPCGGVVHLDAHIDLVDVWWSGERGARAISRSWKQGFLYTLPGDSISNATVAFWLIGNLTATCICSE